MPGDPLRAQLIAEQYLEDPVEVTNVRAMSEHISPTGP